MSEPLASQCGGCKRPDTKARVLFAAMAVAAAVTGVLSFSAQVSKFVRNAVGVAEVERTTELELRLRQQALSIGRLEGKIGSLSKQLAAASGNTAPISQADQQAALQLSKLDGDVHELKNEVARLRSTADAAYAVQLRPSHDAEAGLGGATADVAALRSSFDEHRERTSAEIAALRSAAEATAQKQREAVASLALRLDEMQLRVSLLTNETTSSIQRTRARPPQARPVKSLCRNCSSARKLPALAPIAPAVHGSEATSGETAEEAPTSPPELAGFRDERFQ